MKRLTLILGLFLFSCNNPEESVVSPVEVDSVLIKSQQNLITSDSVQKKSDSTTKEQVIKVIREFKILTNEVEKFKTERISLINELKLSKENIIVRIDTVFVETKKNFWGKEKTSVNTKTETKSSEIIDSTLSEKKVIDTLNQQ
jgi:hypothetical protein